MRSAVALALLCAVGCTGPTGDPATGDAVPVEAPAADRPDWGAAFAARGAVGTFVLLEPATGRTQRHDAERAATRVLPASTFKVYNALVALETGAVGDPDSLFVWDGTERFLPSWNQDQSLRDGLGRSTVWLYQRVARAVGRARYAQAFAAEPYGNAAIGDDVGLFWLDGSLRISADEQVAFLDRLRRGDTAFRDGVEATVRGMMPVLADTAGVRLVGKTGWGRRDGSPDVGWLVGWVERPAPGGDAVFAMRAEADGPDSGFAFGDRLEIVREILALEGILPQ